MKFLKVQMESFAEIQAIPQPQFRAIATQLAEITAVKYPTLNRELYPIPKTYPEGYRQPLTRLRLTAYTPIK